MHISAPAPTLTKLGAELELALISTRRRPNNDHWNATRSCQLIPSPIFLKQIQARVKGQFPPLHNIQSYLRGAQTFVIGTASLAILTCQQSLTAYIEKGFQQKIEEVIKTIIGDDGLW